MRRLTDAEPINTRVTKVTRKVKGGHCGRNYVGQTIINPEILY